ncbi:hypothetical protein BN129_2135 [Cronobacter sakazakii 701]|nr:hypothetical protein BN129_2135 [Cronobacter sakazakii 701]
MMEIAIAQRVVQHFALALRRLTRRADDMQHRHRLSVTTGNGVERAEFADAIGRQQRADAVTAGVPVGGISAVKLIRAADPGNTRVGNDVIEEQQIVISRYAKQVLNTTSCQTIQQIIGNTIVNWHFCHPFSGTCSEY